MRTIARGPAIALLALIALVAFGQWRALQPAQKQTPRVEAKQETTKSGGGNSKTGEQAPSQGQPSSKPERANAGEHAENSEILGVKRGEWLLFLATLGLWYATFRLVKGADETSKRQLRAYVYVEFGKIEFLDGGSSIRGEINFKNFGQTPAYDFEAWANIAVFEKNKPVFNRTKLDTKNFVTTVIGPGGTSVVTRVRKITNPEMNAITKGDKRSYMWGKLVYKDAFDNPHEWDFQVEAAPGSRKGNEWSLAPCPDPQNKTN